MRVCVGVCIIQFYIASIVWYFLSLYYMFATMELCYGDTATHYCNFLSWSVWYAGKFDFFLHIFTVANELLKFRNVHILPLKLSCCRANCRVLLLKCVGRLCDINAKVVNRFNIFFFHWQFSIQMRAYDTVYRVPTEVTELSIKSRRHVVRIGYLV